MSGSLLPNLGLTGDIADHAAWGVAGRANDRRLDALVMASVKEVRNDPPGGPGDGDRYLIDTAPSGAWATHAGQVAAWNGTTWLYYTPKKGWSIYVESNRTVERFHDAWTEEGNSGGAVFDVTSYGAKGDGVTDDSAAVVAALNAVPAGSRLRFPSGTYLLSTITTYTLNKALWISGEGMGNSVIKGAGVVNLLSISANFRCSDLTFDTWGIVLDFSPIASVLDKVRIENTEIKNFGKAIYAHNTNAGYGFRGFTVANCRLATGTSTGIYLDIAIMERVHIHHNEILDVSSRGMDMGANALGFADDRGEYLIEHNIVDGVRTTAASSLGIACYGWRAAIDGNIVRNIVRTPTVAVPTESDCDGIYTKCRYAEITKNVLIDAGQAEGFINIKGGAKRETVIQPFGYAVQCEGNILIDTQSPFNNVSVDPTTDTFTSISAPNGVLGPIVHNMNVGETVRFNSSSIIPAPLVADTNYYIVAVPTSSTFQVSATLGGAVLDITSAGSGTHGVTRFPRAILGVLAAPPGGTPNDGDSYFVDGTVSLSGAFIGHGGQQATYSAALGTWVFGTRWKRSNGIKLATSEVLCANNYLEGICDAGIYFDSDSGSDAPDNNLWVRGNTIKNHVGRAAISIFGRGNRISVTDNRIDTVHGIFAGGQTMGIDLSNKEGSDLDISRNRITNVVLASSTPVGISLSPSTLSKSFSVDGTTHAVTTTASSSPFGPLAHAFSIGDPVVFVDTGGGIPANVVSGTPYYVRDILSPNSFTVTVTPGGVGALLLIGAFAAGSTTLVYKKVTLSGWTIRDNYVDGARYGIQVTVNQTYLAVDQVYMLHNMGRNINGSVIPAAGDLVKYTDTPSNLTDIPASAAGGVPAVIISGANLGVMKSGLNAQEMRIYSTDDGAGNTKYLSLRGDPTHLTIDGVITGSATQGNLEWQLNGARVMLMTSSSLQPNVSNAQDLGASGNQWRNLWLTGNLVLSGAGKTVTFDQTNTGTVGAVTINKMNGSVIVASGQSSVVLTNNLLTATSHVFCTLRTADGTNFIKSVVYSATPSPQVTITLNAAAGANLTVDFVVFS